MGYFNNFLSHGLIEFSQASRMSGTNGFIIPDLPLEEAKRYKSAWESFGIGTVSFAAVTDTKERLELIAKNANDFIYLVAFAGITGADKSEDLSETLKVLKANSDQSVFVGFGVNETTAKERAKGADGVIVGTALVKYLLDDTLSNSEKLVKMSECVRVIKGEINS
jgi:tryptophan synthase alpha chain